MGVFGAVPLVLRGSHTGEFLEFVKQQALSQTIQSRKEAAPRRRAPTIRPRCGCRWPGDRRRFHTTYNTVVPTTVLADGTIANNQAVGGNGATGGTGLNGGDGGAAIGAEPPSS